MARVRSYGSIEGHSLDRTTSFGSVASESPGSSCYSDPRGQDVRTGPPCQACMVAACLPTRSVEVVPLFLTTVQVPFVR